MSEEKIGTQSEAEPSSTSLDKERVSAETVRDLLDEASPETTADSEWHRSAAAPYIDDRSFRTKIHQVLGPTHTGSGDIKYYVHSTVKSGDLVFGQVIAATVDKVHQVYVQPPTYEQTVARLQEDHVIILYGQRGCGKWTTAIYLGTELCNSQIIEVTPNVDLSQFCDNLSSQQQVCYVVDSLQAEAAESLTRALLVMLKNRLSASKVNSYLVLCIDSEVRLPTDQLQPFLTNWTSPTDRQQMFHQHFKYYLPEASTVEQALGLIDSEPLSDFLDGHVSPGEIDKFCQAVADWMVAEEQDINGILERLESYVYHTVQEWFEENSEDLFLVAMMIATAAFQGMTYETISEAAETLQQRLVELTGQSIAGSGKLRTRTALLTQLRAHAKRTSMTTPVGRITTEAIYFDNLAFQPLVLEYVWSELGIGRELVEWIMTYTSANNHEVRSMSAITLGQFSKYNFTYVFERAIRHLAKSEIFQERYAAALALGVPIWTPELAPLVISQLHHWATLNTNPHLQQTAAVAYGDLAGIRFPDLALEDLCLIASSEKRGVINSVARSVINLFQAGTISPDYYFKVLKALTLWVSSSSDIVSIMGILIFFDICTTLRSKPEEADESWLTIIWLASNSDEVSEWVHEIFKAGLNRRSIRGDALNIIKFWLGEVPDTEGSNLTYGNAIEDLIVGWVQKGTDHERERLLTYLNRWGRHPTAPLKVAERIVSRI